MISKLSLLSRERSSSSYYQFSVWSQTAVGGGSTRRPLGRSTIAICLFATIAARDAPPHFGTELQRLVRASRRSALQGRRDARAQCMRDYCIKISESVFYV